MPYLVAVGADTEAVDFYLQRRDTDTALVLAKMSEGRPDVPSAPCAGITSDIEGREGGALQSEVDEIDVRFSQAGPPCSISSQRAEMNRKDVVEAYCQDKLKTTESFAKRDLVLAVNNRAAANFIASSRPIHAAAQLLAVGDAASAVRILSACGEDDLAYAVSTCMGLDTDFHLISMAEKMATYDALPEAVVLLNGINGLGQRWLQKENQQGILELDYGKKCI